MSTSWRSLARPGGLTSGHACRGRGRAGQLLMELWLLNHLSTLALALIMVGTVVVLALAGSVLTYRWHPALAEGEHNDMIGAGLGMFAAIYGIILAFVVVT